MTRSDKLWLVLQAVSVCGGIGLGYVLGYKFPFDSSKDVWEIFAVLGTWAAVAVALWLGVSTQRQLNKQALAIARVTAAKWLDEVSNLQARLVRFQINGDIYIGSAIHHFDDFLRSNAFDFEQCEILQVSTEDLARMEPLGHGIAFEIGRSISTLKRIASNRQSMVASGLMAAVQGQARDDMIRVMQAEVRSEQRRLSTVQRNVKVALSMGTEPNS